tara:strand:+ start:418 stop:1680 length:1263 start_codon:yes stop_codon:yes gene_type:complete
MTMPGEGNRGSSSGLRFNPREAPEFIEEDRTHAMGDQREQEKTNAKKLKDKDERKNKLAGLHHLKVKVEQRDPEPFDSQEQVGEQASLTGPPGMSQAFPPGGGLGGGALVQTGEPMDMAFEMLKGKKKDHTVTIESEKRKERSKKGARSRKKKGPTIEAIRHKRKRGRGGPLSVFTRHPGTYSGTVRGARATVGQTPGVIPLGSTTGPRFRGTGQQRPSLAAPDPRRREAEIARSRKSKEIVTQPVTPPIPFQTGQPPRALVENPAPGAKRNTALTGPSEIRQPRTADTPGGAETTRASQLATGKTGPKPVMAKGKIGDALTTMAAHTLGGLMARPKRAFSQADVADIKTLLQRLKRIMKSDEFQKSFYDGKGDGEKSSPNAHPRQTSAPTGATEADPDDDPTLWGAHPIGLLAPRRGHQ